MSIFGKILDKLGFDAGAGKVEEMLRTPVPAQQPATAVAGNAPAAASPARAATAAAPAAPTQSVDVTALLEQKAAGNAQKLNWRTSIVDLLKLLDLDSSLQARKDLAAEFHCPPEVLADSAHMNTWLHKVLMQKLAANGGKVPSELLH